MTSCPLSARTVKLSMLDVLIEELKIWVSNSSETLKADEDLRRETNAHKMVTRERLALMWYDSNTHATIWADSNMRNP